MIEVRNCPVCLRDFMPSNCQYHCGSVCCRGQACENAKPYTLPRRYQADRHCIVCGRSNQRYPFEAFAECDSNCKRVLLRGRQGIDHVARMGMWICRGVMADDSDYPLGRPEVPWHNPEARPRVHIKYCSLRYFYSPTYGHAARKNGGNSIRNHRYWAKRGNKSAILREMRSRGITSAQVQAQASKPAPWYLSNSI